jgi:hypothetical protein
MNKLKHLASCILTAATLASALSCSCSPENEDITNSVYYWRTTFEIDSAEHCFIRDNDIRRIYLRMFDVGMEYNFDIGDKEITPIATTQFTDSVPEGIEIVPTTFITIEALREMNNKEAEYAKLIVERLKAMATYNNCGDIREIQFDCDWTTSTRDIFDRLCKAARNSLNQEGIKLSVTVRLHQLKQEAPEADYGVLMVYNTGKLKDPRTKNSILNIDDVRPYLTRCISYPLPLSHAYPLYGWGILFSNDKFQRIVTNPDSTAATGSETIRIERPSTEEVLQVKTLVEQSLGKPSRGNIIYHLDSKQLKEHDNHEISKIFARY